MIEVGKFVCSELTEDVQKHISSCPFCSSRLGSIFKEFPILRMLPGLETSLNEFLKGATHGNSPSDRQGKESKTSH